MPKPRIIPRARLDLIEIWNYIADDSPANADALIDELRKVFQMLARQPNLGRRRSELPPDILSFPFGRYVVFYRVHQKNIEIVRVLHGARDLESIFGG